MTSRGAAGSPWHKLLLACSCASCLAAARVGGCHHPAHMWRHSTARHNRPSVLHVRPPPHGHGQGTHPGQRKAVGCSVPQPAGGATGTHALHPQQKCTLPAVNIYAARKRAQPL